MGFLSSAPRTAALVVVRGSGVSVALATRGKAGATILAQEKRTLPQLDRTPEHAAAALKLHIADAGAALAKAGHPQVVYCLVSAPWVATTTLHASQQFPREEKIASSHLVALAGDVLRRAQELPGFLEATTARVLLNGYPTESPEGRHAHRIELVGLVTSCEPLVQAALEEALAQLFPGIAPTFHSDTQAMLQAIPPNERQHDGMFLEVREDGASAFVMRSGIPEQSGSCAEGLQSIGERAKPGTTLDEVRRALADMAREQCSSESCLAIEQGLAAAEAPIAHMFGEFFAQFANGQRVPATLLLKTDPLFVPWLSRLLSRIDFTQFTETAQPFVVVPVQTAPVSAAAIAADFIALINKA